MPQSILVDRRFDSWAFLSSQEYELVAHLLKMPTRLSDWVETNRLGVVTGANEVYLVTDEIVQKYKLERELLRPIIRGSDIKRWVIEWSGLWLIFPYIRTKNELISVDLGKYPHVRNYLEERRPKLVKRYCVKKGGKEWYELHDPVAQNAFEAPKIMTPDISEENRFALDLEGKYYGMDTTFSLVPKYPDNLYVLAGFLNSAWIRAFLSFTTQRLGDEASR